MQIKNARAWALNTPSIYVYSVAGTAAAFFVRYELHPILQAQFPILFFLFNSTIVAYKFGWKPATLSAILGLTLAYYFFIPPFNSIELPNFLDFLTLIIYSLLFLMIIYLIEKLQRERYRAILIARVSESRMRIMAKLSSKVR